MPVIWKIPLRITDYQEVSVPRGAVPLSVAVQDRVLQAWVLVEPELPRVNHPVWVIGTGRALDDTVDLGGFLGTVQNGHYVWHVFWTWDPDAAAGVPAMESAVLDIAAAATTTATGGW
jgi:hypothetical protein